MRPRRVLKRMIIPKATAEAGELSLARAAQFKVLFIHVDNLGECFSLLPRNHQTFSLRGRAWENKFFHPRGRKMLFLWGSWEDNEGSFAKRLVFTRL